MKREIVLIDRDKCDGCGQCVTACAEGAIQIVDGKAELVKEIYCDGLGACIGECPTGALTIEVREAPGFDEGATNKHIEAMSTSAKPPAGGCPGAALRSFAAGGVAAGGGGEVPGEGAPSALSQWPLQLRLVPPMAPFLKNADILICADCVPFAVGDFHKRYLEGRVVLVGCPKLDDLSYYAEKIASVITEATPRSITVLRMEVPCCGGIAMVTVQARNRIAPDIPLEIHTIGIDGSITVEKLETEVVNAREGGAK